MQIGILVETLRREGYELSISSPKVIYKKINGKEHEPIEEVQLDIQNEYVSQILERLNTRLAEIEDLVQDKNGKAKISNFFH
jgi:GTP-binding protein